MNRHKSESILIQSILCNNVFYHTYENYYFGRKAKFENFVRGLMSRHVKIISLVLSNAEHYMGSNPDVTSSISWAVTPYPQTI